MGLAFLLLGERIPATAIAALTAAIAGVVLVVAAPEATGDLIGVALTIAAVGACASYTVLTRWLTLEDSSLSVVLLQQAVALAFAILLTAIAVGVGGAHLGLPADPSTWALAATSGTLYYGLAFWFFISGLRGVPATLAGMVLPLTPVFGLAAAHLLGDRLSSRQWLGAATVVLGTAAALLVQSRRAPTARPAPR